MQGLVDIITTITGSIRFIFGLFFLCIFGLGLMITAGTTYVAPKAAESIAERAERASDKAIEAARIEARNRANAAEGWGYSDEGYSEPDFAHDPAQDTSGWGN